MFYAVYSRPLQIIYKTTLCSGATLLNGILWIFVIVAPFLISYFTTGFWVKSVECTEQPDVSYRHEVTMVVQTGSREYYWSTNEEFNRITPNNLAPLIKSTELDRHLDGQKDEISFRVQFPFLQTSATVTLLFTFDYKLNCIKPIEIPSLAYISTTISERNKKILSDLNVYQRKNIKSRLPSKQNLFPEETIDPKNWKIHKILENYWRRDVSTRLDILYESMGPVVHNITELNLRILYPPQTIKYDPSVSHILKIAWIQYLSIFFVCLFLSNGLRQYIYANQILRSWPVYPQTPFPNK